MSRINNQQGMALLTVLGVITVVLAGAFALNSRIRDTAESVATLRDRVAANQLLCSGVQLAESILIKDKKETEIDSLQEEWADPAIVAEYTQSLVSGNRRLIIEISDELSRIQINALVAYPKGRDFVPAQQELWYKFFDMLLAKRREMVDEIFSEPITPANIINPVKDWLDFGDNDAITGISGAEDDYYRSLDPPYGCKNGPIDDINELMRIKGIPPELFSSMGTDMSGLFDYITVYGMVPDPADKHKFTFPGKININTAPAAVIAAMLPPGEEFLASEICDYRVEKANDTYVHDLSSPTWYKDVPGCSDIEIKPELITVQSDFFRIDCTAQVNDTRLSAQVVVYREKDKKTGNTTCRVLNWTYK